MHRSIGGLGSNELVERIPGHALDIVTVLGNLPDHDAWMCLEDGWVAALGKGCTCLGVVDAGNVVHATCDEELAVGRPSKVIDFRAHGPAHVLHSPSLFIFWSVVTQLLHWRMIGRNPEQDHAIVAGGGKDLAWELSDGTRSLGRAVHTFRCPSHHVHSLRVLREGGQVAHLALLAVGFHLPELSLSASSLGQKGCWEPTLTLLSPPAVARRPFPWGSKCAE